MFEFQAQNNSISDIAYVQKLVNTDSLDKAKTELNKQIEYYLANKNYDTLSHYVYILGKIELSIINKDKTIKQSLDLAKKLEKNALTLKSRHQIKIDLSKLFNEQGNPQKAYDYAKQSKVIALKQNDNEPILNSDYRLSEYALRTGNINLFEQHTRDALKIIKKNPSQKFKISARVYNYLGALMYFTSKPDSAYHYYQTSLKSTIEMDDNPENRLYFPASIKSNIVLLKQSQSKYAEAMLLIQESIKLYKEFLNSTHNHPLTFRVQRNLSLAYRNLSSLYFDLGDFEKSKKISGIAYKHAKENLLPNSLENFSAITVLAEVIIPLKEFKYSLSLLNEAEIIVNKIPGDNFVTKANMYYNKGLINKELKNYEDAKKYLELSNHFHQKAHPNEYSRDRLFVITNLSLVLATMNEKKQAISILKNTYNYFLKNKSEQSNLINIVLVALAKTSMLTDNYKESLEWSKKSIALYEKYNDTVKNSYDKSHFEGYKAEVLILNAKSRYQLSKTKDSLFLKNILIDVKKAIHTLEERRALITSVIDVNRLIDNNYEAFNFAKKINLELYQLTNNPRYLNKTISLHESALYNRIRARLNLKKSISFTDIPSGVIERENMLRKLQNSNFEEQENNPVQSLIENNNKWTTFLDSLKTFYPKYYKMRYATIEEPLNNLHENIPKHSTVLRYIFIENELYAAVINNQEKKIFKLDSRNIENLISQLSENPSDLESTSSKLHMLYHQLWQPFEKEITTDHVIIIPDGILFNLSFESLTPAKVKSFKELGTNSLLSNYTISYNYSLLLLDAQKNPINFQKDFIAFAPEFNDKMKQNYSVAIQDSLSIDETYLTLLPQPFSVDLAKAYSRLFNGDYFINENASKQIFKNEANEHKIIHIGTHAESNNVSPELSRLIFAKNIEDEDNSLYTYEIYNENLNSNLAILTACETGKPTYQTGEGMISLAHAFNYAGSESILTSLWKIDEQSSSKIIQLFYDNIKKGLPKDKALQQAKLDYIDKSEGRVVHPQYWAGLVLIGDTNPISLNTTSNIIWYLLSALLLILATIYIIKTRKK
ncbi:CHAT domain-containing protein [uncultured Algibacter sp.]|uniref:CHAT domain-containing protein n=1 Tax=uncultured Algibacter sp. TaxID=298659 RepID=UPI002616C0F4|nr:CHAT domain-containing protein [uncultured Algibacter sp.]